MRLILILPIQHAGVNIDEIDSRRTGIYDDPGRCPCRIASRDSPGLGYTSHCIMGLPTVSDYQSCLEHITTGLVTIRNDFIK